MGWQTWKCNFQTHLIDWDILSISWGNCPQVNVTRLHRWLVNIGSVNGLVLSGCEPLPEPMLTHMIHMISLGHSELNVNYYLWCPVILTHWGRVTHIGISKLTIISSDNGLSPARRQAIIWTIAGILLIGPLSTNFSEILIEIHVFSIKKKTHLKWSSAKWQPFCLRLDVLIKEKGVDICKVQLWFFQGMGYLKWVHNLIPVKSPEIPVRTEKKLRFFPSIHV